MVFSGNNIPYHPKTNPIETYFSELKHYIKLDSKIEYNDLLKSIKKSIKKIKKSHYRNHFKNSLSNKNFIKTSRIYSSKKITCRLLYFIYEPHIKHSSFCSGSILNCCALLTARRRK